MPLWAESKTALHIAVARKRQLKRQQTARFGAYIPRARI